MAVIFLILFSLSEEYLHCNDLLFSHSKKLSNILKYFYILIATFSPAKYCLPSKTEYLCLFILNPF